MNIRKFQTVDRRSVARTLRVGLIVGFTGGVALCAAVGSKDPTPVAIPFFIAAGACMALLARVIAGHSSKRSRENRLLTVIKLDNFLTIFFVASIAVVLLPSIHEARETARHTKCRNYLRIGIPGIPGYQIIVDDNLDLVRVTVWPPESTDALSLIGVLRKRPGTIDLERETRVVPATTIALAAHWITARQRADSPPDAIR